MHCPTKSRAGGQLTTALAALAPASTAMVRIAREARALRPVRMMKQPVAVSATMDSRPSRDTVRGLTAAVATVTRCGRKKEAFVKIQDPCASRLALLVYLLCFLAIAPAKGGHAFQKDWELHLGPFSPGRPMYNLAVCPDGWAYLTDGISRVVALTPSGVPLRPGWTGQWG